MTRRSAADHRPSATGAGGDLAVEVTSRQRALAVNTAWLERVARKAMLELGAEVAEIGVLVVDDRRIAKLHADWMQDPEPTDVITFDLGSDPPRRLSGDIAVSGETARRLARELGWQPRHELAYYMIHGLLHLAGYDDLTPGERRRMRKAERAVMVAVGLPAPPRRPPSAARRSRHAR
jgi:probable rRNA maturation factor